MAAAVHVHASPPASDPGDCNPVRQPELSQPLVRMMQPVLHCCSAAVVCRIKDDLIQVTQSC